MDARRPARGPYGTDRNRETAMCGGKEVRKRVRGSGQTRVALVGYHAL